MPMVPRVGESVELSMFGIDGQRQVTGVSYHFNEGSIKVRVKLGSREIWLKEDK